jgi:hypothetical protein
VFAVCSANQAFLSRTQRQTVCDTGKYSGNTANFVELKTSLTIRGSADETKFEKYASAHLFPGTNNSASSRKLLKFYLQSFLLGVPVRHSGVLLQHANDLSVR